jgi:hypothetical protein
MQITLIPRSANAKRILAHTLHNDPVIEVTQIGDGRVFVFNPRVRFATWISTRGDPDWDLSLSSPVSPPSLPVTHT